MPAKPSVFISYRRSDSKTITGRITDRLVDAFGESYIFKDSLSIGPGDDFRGKIRDGVGQAIVVLVIIGPNWLTVTEKDSLSLRRLDNPEDWVRIEVETALERAANASVRLIPILVEGASIPSPTELPFALRELAFKAAVTVREDPDFHSDMGKLINFLNTQMPVVSTPPVIKEQSNNTQQKRLLEAAMPACSTLGADTQLKVKISLLDSIGLRGELPEVLPCGDIIQQGDVLSSQFEMRFHKDKGSGVIITSTLCVEVSADDFQVSLPRAPVNKICDMGQFELHVPPTDDSRTLNFHLKPKSVKKTGLSLVYIHIFQNGESIADTAVQTHIVNNLDEMPICGDWRLSTIPASHLFVSPKHQHLMQALPALGLIAVVAMIVLFSLILPSVNSQRDTNATSTALANETHTLISTQTPISTIDLTATVTLTNTLKPTATFTLSPTATQTLTPTIVPSETSTPTQVATRVIEDFEHGIANWVAMRTGNPNETAKSIAPSSEYGYEPGALYGTFDFGNTNEPNPRATYYTVFASPQNWSGYEELHVRVRYMSNVSGSSLKATIVIWTGSELCYFEDGNFQSVSMTNIELVFKLSEDLNKNCSHEARYDQPLAGANQSVSGLAIVFIPSSANNDFAGAVLIEKIWLIHRIP